MTAPLDVIDLVESLGLDVVRRDQSGIGWSDALCPFHDDRHSSFRISAEGGWICLALNSCGKGNLAALVSRLKPDLDTAAAQRWLMGFVATSDAVQRALEKPPAPEPRPLEDFPYERSKTHPLMFDRGFTGETLRRWDVGWLPANRTPKGREAVIIPVDFRGTRLGLIYRYIEGKPKYQHPGIPCQFILFGWDLLPPDPQFIVVTEGPLDAMWFDQAKVPAVALLGSHMSEMQADLLTSKSRSIALALDSDDAGRKGMEAALPLLESRAHIHIAKFPEGIKDAQEMPMTQVEELVNELMKS